MTTDWDTPDISDIFNRSSVRVGQAAREDMDSELSIGKIRQANTDASDDDTRAASKGLLQFLPPRVQSSKTDPLTNRSSLSSLRIHAEDNAQSEAATVVVSQELEDPIPDSIRRKSLETGQFSKPKSPNGDSKAVWSQLRDVSPRLDQRNEEPPQPVSETLIRLQRLIENSNPTNRKHLISWYQSLGRLFIEPPVAVDERALRSLQNCGRRLFDDFVELRPGAAKVLEKALNTASQQQPPGQHQTPSQNHNTPSLPEIGTPMDSNITPALIPIHGGSASTTPYHPRPTNGRPGSATIACDQESKWLLICARMWQRPTSLLHLNVCSMVSDQQLFIELRRSYLQLKKAWYQKFSLKAVQTIRFVQFELHPRDLVDVRKLPDMPPEARKDEYLYQPCDLLPPIGENFMTHLFHHPHEANEKAITFLRAPKKPASIHEYRGLSRPSSTPPPCSLPKEIPRWALVYKLLMVPSLSSALTGTPLLLVHNPSSVISSVYYWVVAATIAVLVTKIVSLDDDEDI
ncbi:MAG: hypothetical protein Q9213_006622 [Squamulea squamosa]